jgi:hypothetical protein
MVRLRALARLNGRLVRADGVIVDKVFPGQEFLCDEDNAVRHVRRRAAVRVEDPKPSKKAKAAPEEG